MPVGAQKNIVNLRVYQQMLKILPTGVSGKHRLLGIARGGERPWLIPPEQPEAFVRALSAKV
jgi:hypothetical protein